MLKIIYNPQDTQIEIMRDSKPIALAKKSFIITEMTLGNELIGLCSALKMFDIKNFEEKVNPDSLKYNGLFKCKENYDMTFDSLIYSFKKGDSFYFPIAAMSILDFSKVVMQGPPKAENTEIKKEPEIQELPAGEESAVIENPERKHKWFKKQAQQ